MRISPQDLALLQARHRFSPALPQRPGRALGTIAARCRVVGLTVRRPWRTDGVERPHSGRRPDLDDRYFRSSWEANYARYLNLLRSRGDIATWAYEAKTFLFTRITRGTRSYTPDFRVDHPDGRHEWHEVKGWLDAKSKTRLARMARYYPGETVRVIDREWFRQARRSGLTALIPGWETRGRGRNFGLTPTERA